MLLNPSYVPQVAAGAKIARGDAFGRIGLMAVTAQREIVALTVATVIGDGEAAIIYAGERRIRTSAARQITGELEGDSPVACLICAVPINSSMRPRSEFGGLEEASDPTTPKAGTPLFLERELQRVPLGDLVGFGATFYRQKPGRRMVYHGALEIDTTSGVLLRGDAGLAVTTQEGAPVGLLVGIRGTIAIVAPLEDAFRAARLRPLKARDASRHFGTALIKSHGEWLADFMTQELQPKREDLLPLELERELESLPTSDRLVTEFKTLVGTS